jgi:leucine zipper transcription factor-like protein 1
MSSASEVQDFVKFFKSKREVSVGEVEAAFEDAQDAAFVESMYTRDDVDSGLRTVLRAIKSAVTAELERTVNMAAVVLHSALKDAEAEGLDIRVNMAASEDEDAIESMARLRLSAAPEARGLRGGGAVKLDSIRDEHGRLVSKAQSLEDQVATLTSKCASLQGSYAEVMREKGALERAVEALREEVASARASSSAHDAAADAAAMRDMRDALDEAKAKIRALSAELEDAREAAASASAAPATAEPGDPKASKQFKQMRAMLTKKNAQLVDLRRRLAVYEPDSTRMIDDDE